ncbi:MAG TPA: protein kinase [Pseudonocardiaceae bacterium]
MTLLTGRLLAQRYRLGRRIAAGGMGEVWQAEDTRLGRQIAVKMLKPELSGDAEFRHRFRSEARMTAALNHPGIAAVYDYGEAATASMGADQDGQNDGQNIAFLVMELVAGEPLSAILLRHRRLTDDHTLDILGQAGDALQAAHERGMVHRDIKPGNILITPAGRVKLTDFGIAKAADAAPITRHGMVMGTAHYIAPEQAAGHEASPASDVYSLGVVGYECLAGQRPFLSDNPLTVAMMHVHDTPPPLPPDVPPGIRTLIEATLVKDPAQRHANGGEFATAVRALRAGHELPLPAGHEAGPGVQPSRQTLVLTPRPTTPRLLTPRPETRPEATPYTEGRTSSYPPRRRPGRRGGLGVLMALFAVVGLVVGGYLIREAVFSAPERSTPERSTLGRSTPDTTGNGAAPQQPAAAAPSDQPPPAEPTTNRREPIAVPTIIRHTPGSVFVVPTDYLFRSGTAAAAIARDKGLRPQVVDEQGARVEAGRRSKCQVIGLDPAAGWVAPGSSLALTCKEGL